MALVLDIETVGQSIEEIPERALDYLFRGLERDRPEPEELEGRRQDLISRFGLDPTTGRVIVIGLVDTEKEAEHVFSADEERELLASFWEWLSANEPECYVSFNGKRFDVPYLNVRSAIHGLSPRVVIPSAPLTTRPHFDVREALEGNDRRRRGSLDYFCAVFGVPSPKSEMDGAAVGQAYEEGRLDEIVRYCLRDCRATAAIYEKLAPFYSNPLRM